MPRLRNHVNPLHGHLRDTGAAPPTLAAGEEVEVELGCADARFLFERAAARPGLRCFGLELRRDLVDDVNQRAQAAGLTRLMAVFANAKSQLDALFPDGRLARVFVNFPDPWFKRRHQKRRVINPELVATVARKLVPGGELFFQSDVFELALDAMAAIEACERFTNLHGEWSFAGANPFAARSLREVRCQELGRPIWRLHHRLR